MISCVMVTGRERGFANMPEVAVQCFLDQEYQDCELLVLNHGEKNFSGRNVWDIKIKKNDTVSLGTIRNMAFVLAGGDYLATWDDDDWHHPKRLALQVRFARPGKIVTLKNRIQVDLNSKNQGVLATKAGSHASMVFPRDTANRFPDWPQNADVQFAHCFHGATAIENPPEFYVHMAHGKNLTDISVIMKDITPLNDGQIQLVEKIRGLYKLAIVSDK